MSPAARALRALVLAYRAVISPWLPPRCRFWPTCSSYAAEALTTHGAVRGLALAARRIARCHPWNAGGFDPVPTHRRDDAGVTLGAGTPRGAHGGAAAVTVCCPSDAPTGS